MLITIKVSTNTKPMGTSWWGGVHWKQNSCENIAIFELNKRANHQEKGKQHLHKLIPNDPCFCFIAFLLSARGGTRGASKYQKIAPLVKINVPFAENFC